MKKYQRLTFLERRAIRHFYKREKLNQTEIASLLGVSKSTISREIKRNSGLCGYRPRQAQRLSAKRQLHLKKPRKMTAALKSEVERLIKLKWSPEQVSNRLKIEGKRSISYETIYKDIYADKKRGGKLWKNLRRSHRKRRKRFSDQRKRGFFSDALSIEKRPQIAEKRSRLGDWERDTMFGSDRLKNLLVLVDRKSRFIKIAKMERKLPKEISRATIKLLRNMPCFSITNDRGFEFADYKRVERLKKVNVYFCHPYSSHERGTNENKIGVLRQYFPKGSDLTFITKKVIAKVEKELNHRPMKCLDWRTPYEVLLCKKVALAT